jgi:signal transduction histidine kinase
MKKTISLTYHDNGSGIKSNIIDNIFEFGFTTSRRGSGIGLYHVKEIIEKMNGKIKANEVEKGAQFLISFKNS